MDQNELPVGPCHQGVPLGSSKMISYPKVPLAQTMHLSCIQTDRNEIPHDTRHVGVPSGASKMIFEQMVRLAQTMHLSCIKNSTISKRTETSFLLSLITDFLGLWLVWRKPCTYLALTLTLSPNRPKWDSTGPASPRIPSGVYKLIFEPMALSLQTMHLSCVKISTFSKQSETSLHLGLVT
jgi:hypothetical protein